MSAPFVMAIDPGPTHSALVAWDGTSILGHEYLPNRELECHLQARAAAADSRSFEEPPPQLVVEMIASYGMAVGADVFETCVWIGRFLARWPLAHADRLKRHAVKMHLCKRGNAKDSNIRQALIDRFGCPKGRKCQACKGKGWVGRGRPVCTSCDGSGWEEPPGITQGLTGDKWAAFAVAVTWFDQSRHRTFETAPAEGGQR